jgi:hypothetical protein
LMLKMWRGWMTVKLLALSSCSHCQQRARGHRGVCRHRVLAPPSTASRSGRPWGAPYETSRARSEAFRCEASVQSRTPSEVKPLLPPWRVRWWSGHGLINEDSAPGLRGLP